MSKTFPMVLLMLSLAPGAFAEPGQPNDHVFKPAASVFEVFLNRLYERTHCHRWANRNSDDKVCSESISYDSNENLIHIYFRIPPDYIWLENFTQLNMEARKKILTDILINTSVNMGVGVRNDMMLSHTLIHSIPVHRAYVPTGLSEEDLKKEIAGRIVVHLHTVKENVSYRITRNHEGKIILGGEAFNQLN